jgi:predicted O-methyltransferase YrrM
MLAPIMAAEGMLSEDEAALLCRLASEAVYPIVEIGSYRGRSTVALALGSRAGAGVPVYAIDPHEDFTEPGGFHFGRADAVAFTQAITDAAVVDIVRVVQLPASAVVFDGAIGLLWIDGDHEAAHRDFLQFGWQIPRGGKLAFHDRELPTVRAAAIAAQMQGFRLAEVVGGIAVMERVEHA